jgi:hypothetical protein
MQVEKKNAALATGKERLEYYCAQFRQEIIEENKRFHMHNRIFSQEFLEFVPRLFHVQTYLKDSSYMLAPFKYVG